MSACHALSVSFAISAAAMVVAVMLPVYGLKMADAQSSARESVAPTTVLAGFR